MFYCILLEEVIEVATDDGIEMNPIRTQDIVFVIGVDHIVRVGAGGDAGVEEGLRVLPHHYRIDPAMDQEQSPPQILGSV